MQFKVTVPDSGKIRSINPKKLSARRLLGVSPKAITPREILDLRQQIVRSRINVSEAGKIFGMNSEKIETLLGPIYCLESWDA